MNVLNESGARDESVIRITRSVSLVGVLKVINIMVQLSYFLSMRESRKGLLAPPSSDSMVDVAEEITSRKQGCLFIFPAISHHLERGNRPAPYCCLMKGSLCVSNP